MISLNITRIEEKIEIKRRKRKGTTFFFFCFCIFVYALYRRCGFGKFIGTIGPVNENTGEKRFSHRDQHLGFMGHIGPEVAI